MNRIVCAMSDEREALYFRIWNMGSRIHWVSRVGGAWMGEYTMANVARYKE